MKVEVVANERLNDFDVEKLDFGEIGILTNSIGSTQSGMPVVRGFRDVVFPSIGKWGNLNGGYRCRRLLPGEKVIFTGE